MFYPVILYALAFGQVLLLYGIAAPQAIRLGEQAFLHRNPEWVEANGAPAAAERLRNLFFVLTAGVGLGQIAGLFVLAAAPFSYSAPAEMLVLPLPILAVVLAVYMWRGHREIYNRIPAPAARTTRLQPRRPLDFVNGWALGIAVLLGAVFALHYVRAFRQSLLPSHLLMLRGGVFALAVAVVFAAMINALTRRERFVAAQGGDAARRLEAGLYVVVLYALIAAYQYLFMADIASIPVPATVVLLLAGTITLQLYAIYACQWAAQPADRRQWPSLLLRSCVIFLVGAAFSLGLARLALQPSYDRNVHLAASVPGNGLNLPDVQAWHFAMTAGKPELRRQLRTGGALPGGAYWHVDVPYKGHERWDTLARISHVKPVKRGDVIEAEVWLRSETPGGAEINGLTQSSRWGWTPIGKATWHVGRDWAQYRVRGVATETYGAGESDFELHLASGKYAFDLGPARVVDLGPETTTKGGNQ